MITRSGTVAGGGALVKRLRRARLRTTPDLVSGFWFLTSLVSLTGPVLAVAVVAVDKAHGEAGVFPTLYISPDSARTILGSISGSFITIASLTSSLTIVTLQLLSNQYTPRTVRGFLSSRLSQVVLGSFIAIFLYCLVVLVTVRAPADENDPFVPSLGVLLSILLTVVGMVLLVVFIHAMSQTIQVSTMAARIARTTAAAVAGLHGADPHAEPGPPAGPGPLAGGGEVRSTRTGYVRGVDLDELLDRLDRPGGPGGRALRVTYLAAPGEFVTPTTVLARVEVPGGAPDDRATAAVRAAVVVARERELRADPAFGVRQLVDITLRALSSGINDPSTAITCLGYLRALLEDIAARDLPPSTTVARGQVSVTARLPTFEDYLEPYLELTGYAGADVRVTCALLDGLESVARCARDDERRHHVEHVREEFRQVELEGVRMPRDRQRLAR